MVYFGRIKQPIILPNGVCRVHTNVLGSRWGDVRVVSNGTKLERAIGTEQSLFGWNPIAVLIHGTRLFSTNKISLIWAEFAIK